MQNNFDGISRFIEKLEVNKDRTSLCEEELRIFKDLINIFNMIVTDESNKLFFCISMSDKYNCREEVYKTDVNNIQSVIKSLNELRNYYAVCIAHINDIKNDIVATVERVREKA